MQVLLQTDMEGVTWITNHRECWPVFPEYWKSGRQRFTDDVVAAASGLLKGGAIHVHVTNGHGGGTWPNLIVDQFPEGTTLATEPISELAYDATFQLGRHARAGTRTGFVNHTHVPGFRIALDDQLITESHFDAWNASVPVLGITGDAALGPQLNNTLSRTPFLATKHSQDTVTTTPNFQSPVEGSQAIHDFACQCLHDSHTCAAPKLPATFTVAFSLSPEAAARVVGEAGLRRKSAAVVEIQGRDWQQDVVPAWLAAFRSQAQPFFDAHSGIDISRETALAYQSPNALERARRFYTAWMDTAYPEWVE